MSSYSKDCFINWEGKILDSRYLMIFRLGHGSYSSVWMCYDFKDTDYYAIKITNREDYRTGEKECGVYDTIKKYNSKILMCLERTFDHETDDGIHLCLVMDLMGNSLYNEIKRIDFYCVLKCIKQVLIGLSELHKNGAIHGDIKPENILIDCETKKQKDIIEALNKIIKNIPKPQLKGIAKNANLIKRIMNELRRAVPGLSDDNIKNTRSGNNSSTSSTNESDDESDVSTYSDETISLSDSENSEESTEYDDNVSEILQDKITIKLTDMGNCILQNNRKRKNIQTCYYRSPELLLNNEYDISCDMWALGCTMYELLFGQILFDADDYNGNTKRHHMFLITEKLGLYPKHLIGNSPKKDVFFSVDMKRIKGHKNIKYNNIRNIIKNNLFENKIYDTLADDCTDFIVRLLDYDINSRLTASSALSHNLMKNI